MSHPLQVSYINEIKYVFTWSLLLENKQDYAQKTKFKKCDRPTNICKHIPIVTIILQNIVSQSEKR